MKVVRQMEMQLRNGGTLTIDVSSQLLEQVRHTFALDSTDSVSEEHVKRFLVSSMTNLLRSCDE